MQNNKILKEFLEHEYNQDSNYKAIVSKTERKPNMKKKILNIAAVILIIIVAGVTVPTVRAKIAWDTEFAEYQNRDKVTGKGVVNEAIQDEYAENINMEYIYKDNIGIKIDSLIITDDTFKMNINFKFDEDMEINNQRLYYSIAVYDENNNIYAVSERFGVEEITYYKKLYQELGIKYNKKNISDITLASSCGYGTLSSVPGNKISNLHMSSKVGFPKSKKLYVRIFDIGHLNLEVNREKQEVKNNGYSRLTDSEWNFEIDVPAKFYERETTELKLVEEIKDVKLNRAEISETGLVMDVEIDGIRRMLADGRNMNSDEFKELRDNTVYVSEGTGINHIPIDMGTNEGDSVHLKFNLSKKDLDKKLFLNVNINGESYKVELIKK